MVAQIDGDFAAIAPDRLWARALGYLCFEGRPVGTRGRWINPAVRQLHRLLAALPIRTPVDAPVFVVGMGRSGTTILGRLLATHPEVGFLNEPKLLWHAVHPEDDIIGSYGAGPGRLLLDAGDAGAGRATRAHRLLAGFLRLSGSRRLVDKYPEMVFRPDYLKALFPDARFLVITRRGWDCIDSVARWSDRHRHHTGAGRDDWWGVDDRKWHVLVREAVPMEADLAALPDRLWPALDDRGRAAVEWILSMRAGLRLVDRFPHHTLRIRLETLIDDPEAELTAIQKAIALPVDRRPAAFARRVLRRGAAADPAPLAEELRQPFDRTMAQLGYPA